MKLSKKVMMETRKAGNVTIYQIHRPLNQNLNSRKKLNQLLKKVVYDHYSPLMKKMKMKKIKTRKVMMTKTMKKAKKRMKKLVHY